MNKDNAEQLPQPTDPSGDEPAGIDAVTSDLDTEGHSMLTPELVRATQSERLRQAEKASRDSARAREARPGRSSGFFDRLRGR
jgi:hypothetical protein